MLQQFIAIIDNAIVMRYSVNKESKERELDEVIKPGYILGTKQRVMLDIINKAKNYELPIVIVSISGISFSKERIASKNTDIYVSSASGITVYPRPTPISMKVDVTIMTKYMTDLYQIYGKLATQFQPALAYSWFVPQLADYNWVELRNKIEWDGELSLDIRTESKNTDEDKFTGKMGFTIDGWLFPSMNKCADDLIFDIGTSIVPSEETLSRIHDKVSMFRPLAYSVVKGKEWEKYNNPRQFASSHPMITSIHRSFVVNRKEAFILIDKNRAENELVTPSTTIVINGYNLSDVKVLAIPCEKSIRPNCEEYHKKFTDFLYPFPESNEEKPSEVSGYLLNITKQSDNQLTINLQASLTNIGEFDLAIVNDIDYDLLSKRKGFTLKS